MEGGASADWIALDADLWSEVGALLGLQALTLGRACRTLRGALALARLPRATQLAMLIIRNTWPRRWARYCQNHVRQDSELLERELDRVPLHVLFGALAAIKQEQGVQFLRHQGRGDYLVSQSCEIFSVCKQRNHWVQYCVLEDKEGRVLTESQLVDAMRNFRNLGYFMPNKTLSVESPENWRDPFDGWTSTWHIAAEKGMLDVLKFLVYECADSQPLHTRTKGGNNAYAHAKRALDRIVADPDKLASDKAREKAKYDRVLAYLRSIGLDTRPWRDPEPVAEPSLQLANDDAWVPFDDGDPDNAWQ